MRTIGWLVALSLSVAMPPTWAETPAAPHANAASSAQTQPNVAQNLPPCPTAAEQTAALGTRTLSGTPLPAGQAAELSGILPSATGPGTGSAKGAPTVQQPAQAVRSPLDCTLVPGHPNALPAGPVIMPDVSKKP